jgi:acyl-CoA dehydrogenase
MGRGGRVSARALSQGRRTSACWASASPRSLWRDARRPVHAIVVSQELARQAGAGGVSASLMSHTIGAPPIAFAGRPEVKRASCPDHAGRREDLRAGHHRTECGGSDVANLRTTAGATATTMSSTARRPSSRRACAPTISPSPCAPAGRGRAGSAAADRARHAGLSRTKLKKMGWWASDTATLHFDDCRVPCRQPDRRGEGKRLPMIMRNFNSERHRHGGGVRRLARVCVEEAIAYARERKTFGKPLTRASGDPPQAGRHGAEGGRDGIHAADVGLAAGPRAKVRSPKSAC